MFGRYQEEGQASKLYSRIIGRYRLGQKSRSGDKKQGKLGNGTGIEIKTRPKVHAKTGLSGRCGDGGLPCFIVVELVGGCASSLAPKK